MKIVIDPGAYLPERAHDLDAGYDLRSPIRAYVPPYSSAIIDVGVHNQRGCYRQRLHREHLRQAL